VIPQIELFEEDSRRMAGEPEEAQVRTNFLLGAAAVGVLITGAIAQTNQRVERIKDAAGHSQGLSAADETQKGGAAGTNQNAHQATQPKKTVRTVYPNTQNGEQAARESRSARGKADASKPGDVTPLPNTPQPATQASTQASPPAQTPQQNAQASSTQQNAPASSPQETATQATQSPTPAATQTAQPGTQPAQPAGAPASTVQSAPTATAQQSQPPEPHVAQPARQGSSGIVALDTQQQTSIGQAIARHDVKPLRNVTFSMAVGTKVPAAVQLRALPSDLATFVPQYRGYSYAVVEEQIVIVDPATQAIVAIVPYTGAAAATRTAESAPAARSVATAAPRSHEAATPRHRRPIAQKPMVSRSVNLNTEEKGETRHPAPEQRKMTRSMSKRDYREREPVVQYRERPPRTVTIEEQAEPVYRVPRPHGFFDFFRSDDDD
jgi:hypothetical protein